MFVNHIPGNNTPILTMQTKKDSQPFSWLSFLVTRAHTGSKQKSSHNEIRYDYSIWLRRQDCFVFVTGICKKRFCVSPLLGCPIKSSHLTLSLDFIDRCTQIPCTASAAGSVQGIQPNKLRSSAS